MTPPNLSLLFIMICFWVTLWLVWKYLIGPVGRVLADRQGRLDDAQSRWDKTHGDYVEATERLEREMEEAAREAARIRGEGRQQALGERQKVLDEARQRADERLQAALSELGDDTDSARRELSERARELARLFASRLLDREVAS
jgi:F-type H+-transporting ATPase subunit b